MSKKYLLPLIGLAAAVAVTGCGGEKSSSESADSATEAVTESPESFAVEDVDPEELEEESETDAAIEPVTPSDYLMADVSDYITLGTYEGLSATQYTYEITDDMVQDYISNDLMMYSEESHVDRPSAEGDTVYVDIRYTMDGQDESGSSEESTYFIIGDEECGPEFDEKLTGVSAGDTLDFTMTFDDDIYNEAWAGQTIQFEIAVTEIWETVEPEYNEEFVQNNTDFSSMEEYESAIRDTLTGEYEDLGYSDAVEELFQTAASQSVISECPEDFITSCKEEVEAAYAAFAEYFGEDDFMTAFGITEDDIESEATGLAERRLLVNAIVLDACIELTEDEYVSYLKDQADANGYDSISDFEQDYTRSSIIWELYEQKVGEILYQSAKIEKTPYTEADTDEEYIEAEIIEDDAEEEPAVDDTENTTEEASEN